MQNTCYHCGADLKPTDTKCPVCGTKTSNIAPKPVTPPTTTTSSGSKKTKPLWVKLLAFLLIAAIFLGAIKSCGSKEETGSSKPTEVSTEASTPQATEATEEQTPEAEETEPPFVADIDAQNYPKLTLTGELKAYGTDTYFLVLKEKKNIIATNNSNNQAIKEADVARIYLNDVNESLKKSFDGTKIDATGTFYYDSSQNNFALDLETAKDMDGKVLKASNVHEYKLVHNDSTWNKAFFDAIDYDKAHNSHLVTIEDEEELNAVLEIIRKQIRDPKIGTQVYIGATRTDDSKDYYFINKNKELYGEKINSSQSIFKDLWLYVPDTKTTEPTFIDEQTRIVDGKEVTKTFIENRLEFMYLNGWSLNDVPDDVFEANPKNAGIVYYMVEIED